MQPLLFMYLHLLKKIFVSIFGLQLDVGGGLNHVHVNSRFKVLFVTYSIIQNIISSEM